MVTTKKQLERYLKLKLPPGFSVCNEFLIDQSFVCIENNRGALGYYYTYHIISKEKPIMWNVKNILRRIREVAGRKGDN